MKITKFGHCCLVIEENGVRIMTDPGAYSTLQNEAKDIDYIFITHEHPDHLHIESLVTVLKNNPRARIVTNASVGKLLDAEKIRYELLEHGQAKEFGGVHVEGCGEKHEIIYENFGQVQNTGYFFGKRLFYPGDAFFNPKNPVEILALPVAGPWMKISDAIDYAKLLKPKVCFPIHDGMLKFNQITRVIPQKFLPPVGVEFVDILEGTTHQF
ncbi:MAG: MBL fold metallo-hydrolase [bacterium]|nr:MBL fold metallo-hydrolase [bacterium]